MDAEESFLAYVRGRTVALSRIAYLLTGDQHAAEDLVQEALLSVVGRWPRLVRNGDPDAYVRKTLYHRYISDRRRRLPQPFPTANLPQRVMADPAPAVARGVVVRAALARLPPRQRAVLVLRYFEDLTEVQTAEVLGCRVGTVKSQTRDALARLRVIAPDLAIAADLPEPVGSVSEVP
ncbi:SigE family RNA polymerase sigma factor [Micromonospora andamanensis]|uniref:RNA polymerase sigma24 factor n=1 Tax=Micromonospora andamanensis TaxID=1287068 RepID=A0ABQ4I3Z4_9ACTN|nr:SigE family RNA polymerase sigma factor [Micromonospora andamanensis]GIJ12516.1 RNA polymerase sigma24 factor [Micromonospora andamanensis]GIJ41999.1 RNA polymerase sigma24 factor [Micromonospora andamanensis]